MVPRQAWYHGIKEVSGITDERLADIMAHPEKFYYERLVDLIAKHPKFDTIMLILGNTNYKDDPTNLVRELMRICDKKPKVWRLAKKAVGKHP